MSKKGQHIKLINSSQMDTAFIQSRGLVPMDLMGGGGVVISYN